MKITLQASIIMSAIFAMVCLAVAINGFTSLGDIADAEQRAAGLGYAWFWTFLGVVALAFGALGVWLMRTHKE